MCKNIRRWFFFIIGSRHLYSAIVYYYLIDILSGSKFEWVCGLYHHCIMVHKQDSAHCLTSVGRFGYLSSAAESCCDVTSTLYTTNSFWILEDEIPSAGRISSKV